jgi:DNA-binding transcriptional ArsR family regulator
MTRTKTTSLDPEVRLLAALADPTRLAIVRQLAQDTATCA